MITKAGSFTSFLRSLQLLPGFQLALQCPALSELLLQSMSLRLPYPTRLLCTPGNSHTTRQTLGSKKQISSKPEAEPSYLTDCSLLLYTLDVSPNMELMVKYKPSKRQPPWVLWIRNYIYNYLNLNYIQSAVLKRSSVLLKHAQLTWNYSQFASIQLKFTTLLINRLPTREQTMSRKLTVAPVGGQCPYT